MFAMRTKRKSDILLELAIREASMTYQPNALLTPPMYHDALDMKALCKEFPPAADYLATTFQLSRDALRALQNERFLKQMSRAWNVPFYRRRGSAIGLEAGDIRSLDDLNKIPPFSVHDLRESLKESTIWTDYIGIDPAR